MQRKYLLSILAGALIISAMLLIQRKRSNSKESSAKTLVLYNWSEYMDPSVLDDFRNEYGIEVIEEIFDSNETVRAKLLAGADGYDVITPSGFMISSLIKEGLLAKLDPSKLPNLVHIDPFFRGLEFDPEDAYSVPYMWMTTGIGYRTDLVKTPPTSWGDILDPEKVSPFAHKVSLLDDPREVLGAALQYFGHSVNSTNPEEIDAAAELLRRQKKYLSRYDSEIYGDFLVAGDFLLAQGWSGTITKAKKKLKDIGYVIPREGGIVGVDSFVIPQSSKRKDEAHVFINYLSRPDIAARIVNKIYYASANRSAAAQINPEILNDPVIYPPRADFDKMEWIQDVGVHNELYEAAWHKIRFSAN